MLTVILQQYRGIWIPIQVLVLDSSSSTHHHCTGFFYSITDKDSPVSVWALHKESLMDTADNFKHINLIVKWPDH